MWTESGANKEDSDLLMPKMDDDGPERAEDRKDMVDSE